MDTQINNTHIIRSFRQILLLFSDNFKSERAEHQRLAKALCRILTSSRTVCICELIMVCGSLQSGLPFIGTISKSKSSEAIYTQIKKLSKNQCSFKQFPHFDEFCNEVYGGLKGNEGPYPMYFSQEQAIDLYYELEWLLCRFKTKNQLRKELAVQAAHLIADYVALIKTIEQNPHRLNMKQIITSNLSVSLILSIPRGILDIIEEYLQQLHFEQNFWMSTVKQSYIYEIDAFEVMFN